MDPVTFTLLLCCFGVFGFLINFIVAYWIFQDAEKLEIPDNFVWVIVGFVAPFIGLLIYVFAIRPPYVTKSKSSTSPVSSVEKKVEKNGPIERN